MCQQKRKHSGPGRKIKLVALNAKYIHSCLALFYVRCELARNCPQAEIEILQLTINDNPYESLLQITAGEPFAVFFSAAIWNSQRVEQLVRDVRSCLPGCRIVVGGPQAGVLRDILPLDICTVVTGEIEAIDQRFYKDLEDDTLAPKYSGSFLKLARKELDYPFCDEDFSTHLKNRHIYYETSRGCPYGCTYCLSAAERGLYHKDLEQVKKELSHILRHKPKVVRFVDRTFNDSPERALNIWQFLLEQETATLFHFEIAPDRFTEEMFALLETVEHGRFQFEIGIQSTNIETLEAIRRKMDRAVVHPIIERMASLKTIHLHVDLILGLPYETARSFARSFSEVFAMGAHYIQMGLLKILPDTPICHGASEYGYIHSGQPPYSVLANDWLDHQEMSELYWFCESVEKFYNNRYFVSFWSYLRETGEDIFEFFMALIKQGEKHGFLHRAATQELLCTILAEVCTSRSDRSLIMELLRYDWLRCGFRKLPACLEHDNDTENLNATRDLLYRDLPDNVEGLFVYSGRNRFFKRSVFLRLSAAACLVTGVGDGSRDLRLGITQDRDSTLYAHNRVVVLGEVREH